jgi:hypothetical protein
MRRYIKQFLEVESVGFYNFCLGKKLNALQSAQLKLWDARLLIGPKGLWGVNLHALLFQSRICTPDFRMEQLSTCEVTSQSRSMP